MNTLPLIVNHKTDPKKVNGLLVSTFSYLGQYEDPKTKTQQMTVVNIHNVVWPEITSPLYHQEADADLDFVSVYDPNADDEERSEEDEANERIVEFLEENHPELYNTIIDTLDADAEDDDAGEVEEADAALATTTTDDVDDAHAPNN